MEWKSNLWRTQSLKSLPSSCDKPTWTEEGLWDKKSSVSQLVARYQTTVEVSASIQVTSVNSGDAKPKQVLKEITPSLLENKETGLASLMRRNEERERSRAKSSLTRSKSMGSLQNGAGSIEALKALFESNAATQSKVKSSFRAANFKSPYKAADTVTVMNGEVEEVKRSAEEQKAKVPADAPVNDAKMDAKADHVTQKVVNNTRTERRKTIGGIDFEKLASSQADEKRRSIADFRDSSFIQTKEKLCVSVKAMSACYMSKVAPQEPTQSPLKLAQDQSSESGKRVKLTKMAEDSLKREDDLPPPPLARHQPGPEDISGAHSQQSMPAFSKEKLYQQRQKCELRRLLKHTHPEVKMLDEVVDEELAEVLSSETVVTAGETGYEGEVLSRRLIFENCALSNKVSPYTPKSHMADRTVDRGDVSKTSTVSEEHEGRLCDESVKGIVEDDKTIGSSPDPNRECEEEMIRIDVQATRRIFENQSVKTLKPNPDNKFQGKVSISRDETGPVQKQIHDSEVSSTENIHCENKRTTCTKSLDLIDQPHKQGPCVHVVRQSTRFSGGEEVSSGEVAFEDDLTSLSGPEEFEESITTSVDLLKNNPFISTNIERENSYVHELKSQIPENPSGAAEEYLVTNVKNRAYLFESLPFDRIRHQNKDEIETLVENIKETLNSLYHVNAIHSGGSIIEVNETMIAKKAKFTLSEGGPKINYDEVAEGGAQNFILQLLPRANLKPQITYLKEDSKGSMKATVVNVPVAQHQFPTSQDTEFKTANVVQLVEDILNQDNSLRKGVIIQKDANTCAEVIVYSLYNYFDEDDVKSYSAPQGHAAEYDEPEMEKTDISKTENQGLRKGIIESAISCLQETSQDQICTGSIRPEVTVKGNVKLFKSCIEKGDLEYLKTLQAEPTVQEQELLPNQTLAEQSTQLHHELRGGQAEESSSEWVPVDVKRLKGMFSGDQRENQTKQNIHENCVQSTTILHPCTGQTVPLGKSQSSGERNIGVYDREQRKNTLWKCGGRGQEEVCNFTAAPLGPYLHLETQDDDRVHQAELVEVVDDTDEISNLQTAIHSLQQATMEAKSLYYSSQNKQIAGDVKHSRTEAELPQENENQKVDLCTEPRWDEAPSASNITSEYKSDRQHENTETCHEKTNSEEVLTTEICNKQGQKGTDVVHKHLEALVDSSKLTPGQQEEEEVVFHGKLQAALDSLERSNINIARGDFKAAMIYRNSSKSHKERSQNVDALSVEKPIIKEFFPVTEPRPTEVPLRQEFSKEEVTAATTEPQSQSETLNKPVTSTDLEKSKKPVVSKPAIPPKPEHLKVKQRDNQPANTKSPEATQTNTVRPEMEKQSKEETVAQPLTTSVSSKDEHMKDLSKINSDADSGPNSVDHKGETSQMSQKIQVRHQVQGSINITDKSTFNRTEDINVTAAAKKLQEKSPVKENMNETDESHVDFHEACQKFGGKKAISVKNAPVKPKRVKIAQPNNSQKDTSGDNNPPILIHADAKPQQTIAGPSYSGTNTSGQTADSKDRHEREMKQESKVEMREKKGRTETEDERRQRLSVHMDEIMRGNITAALEIFDNLRKQEELQSILSRVEEIEQDTSEVDVQSLRRVFENVTDWVVSSDKKKQKEVKVEHREEKSPLKSDPESKSSMAHVFGDLERASEEIMNLKEQTLARLIDIEEAIKKALYSVSTLKSDSDIAGLSCLFKESLGTVQGSPSSGNISKISIGSSRTKSQQAQESPTTKGNTALLAGPSTSNEVASAKRASPPSSPAFISIQSAARKTDKTDVVAPETTICPTCQQSPKIEEKFRTTKTLTCNSPAQNRKRDPRKGGQKQLTFSPLKPKRELSVLEVQTESVGNSVIGTKTVTENYEQNDSFGNRFYSSKTSTVVTTHPETMTTTHQVTTYPEVRLPINQKL